MESHIPQLPNESTCINNSDEIATWNQALKQESSSSSIDASTVASYNEGQLATKQSQSQKICCDRMAALVEVVITYGTACSNHWEKIFLELYTGLKSNFGHRVFVMAQEEPGNYNCLSVHVNNVLVFGCQGRQPSVQQLCQEVRRAMEGKRPGLIPYSASSVCELFVGCKSHKYRI